MLEARGLTVTYPGPPRFVAVQSVDLLIGSGDTVGLVGESGSGKSTLARALVGLSPITHGEIHLDERRIIGPGRRVRSVAELGIQLVFQDPHASLNPRMSLGETLDEAVSLKQRGRGAVRAKTLELVEMVGLSPTHLARYPHQISGGQLQRIAIARALAVQPKFLLLDEVTASLDVSVQARILNLLRRLQRDLGFAMLYISHDLSVIRYVSDHVYVMRHGEIVEQGPVDQIFDHPRIDYTQQLLRSVPTLGGDRWRRATTPSHQEST